jgi:hypothetical protein
MYAPRVSHLNAINRIIRYLKGTPGQEIWMKKNKTSDMVSFSDVDWADSCDRKSIMGFCIFVGGDHVTWKNKKQNIVARSSVESEYRVMTSTASELSWIKYLLRYEDWICKGAMKMYYDNQATRHITFNPVFYERTKHIEVDCHCIKEYVQSREIKISFIRIYLAS